LTNVAPDIYNIGVHATDRNSWFYFVPDDASPMAAPTQYTLTAGQNLVFQDMQIYKHDLASGSPAAWVTLDKSNATIIWNAYSGTAYYGVYIGDPPWPVLVGERFDGNSVTVTGLPCNWWRLEAYNAGGTKISESDSMDFHTLLPPGYCGETANPSATLAAGLPLSPVLPTTVVTGAKQSTAGQSLPFQVVTCPTRAVSITAVVAEAKTGWWDISGTADIPNQDYWKAELSTDGSNWTLLYRSSSPVRDDVLIQFNTGTVPPGAYQIRLTAIDFAGNYPEPCVVQVSTK
jgi:hypothetical protein